MLVVQKPRSGPFWENVLGARVQFDPITRPMVRAARRAAAAALRASGLTVPVAAEADTADQATAAELHDLLGDAFSEALIVQGVKGWEDVSLMADEEAEGQGEPLPFTPENLALVLTDAVSFDAFDAVYVMPYIARERSRKN